MVVFALSRAVSASPSARPRDAYPFNAARVSEKTYMHGLRFHGDVSAGRGR